MITITNIKLNNTSINPSIAPMLFPTVTPVGLINTPVRATAAQFVDVADVDPMAGDAARAAMPVTPQARSLAAFLLAATLAALMVAADQLIETWTDDHLLMGWVVLWTVAFVGMALLARPMRQLSVRLANAWVERVRKQRTSMQDERFWADACLDPRLMADIVAAQTRADRI